MEEPALSTIPEAIEAVRRGEMVVVADDPGRENEGDLLMAAELVTSDAVNFMVTHARGLVCMPIVPDRANALGLGPMAGGRYGRPTSCAFTQSIDLRDGGTGISAEERAACMRRASELDSVREEFCSPGHVFPLIARPGGVLERAGHTEAAIDLAMLAGLRPAGVCCEILNDDGTMARMPELVRFARAHGLHLVTVADLIRYRLSRETSVRRTAETDLPTEHGTFRTVLYDARGAEVLAMTRGDVAGEAVPVLVQRECVLGDAFGAGVCDCGPQLRDGLRRIASSGRGVVVYLRGGLPHGLQHAVHASVPTSDADVAAAAHVLRDLGVRSARPLGAGRRADLEAYGIAEAPETIDLAAVASEW